MTQPQEDRADVRGEFTDDSLTIQGERKHEHEEGRAGRRRSQRSDGRLFRGVSFPAGVQTGKAQGAFKDGVLASTVVSERQNRQHCRPEID